MPENKGNKSETSRGASRLRDVKADKNPEDVKIKKAIRAVRAEVPNRVTAKARRRKMGIQLIFLLSFHR